MEDIYKIPLEKEQFLRELSENWTTFKNDKLHVTKAIALFAVDNNLIEQDFGTISKMAKDKLKDLILKAQEPNEEKATVRQTHSGSNSLAIDIVNILEEIKQEFQNRPLNSFIKKRAVSSISSLMDKFTDDNKLQNLGLIGNGVVLVATFVDVFLDLKSIPSKIKEWRLKRAELKGTSETQSNTK